ncbi:MAG: gamma-glutamyl-gamma-aminobutyrate hydrolase family protein [Alphaproteobacteria bacterium]|nr:gamma-glutamyl-gamma-aminobutyrate hydrolase family protein [Alphaproteobacteria bacterium]
MSKNVVILKHTHNLGACHLGQILENNGFNVNSLGVPIMDIDTFDSLEPDLLLIMGAPVGIYQADDFPFIHKERSFIKARIDKNKPTLGICFGAQIIASALGAKVYLGDKGREIGWHRLTLTGEGKKHSVRHLDGSKTNMFHWHGDTFDLPDGATLLASSDRYRQAFSYGKNILGFQCHTEIGDIRLQEWYVANVSDITGSNPIVPIKELRKQSGEYVEQLNIQTEKFLVEWLESVGLL